MNKRPSLRQALGTFPTGVTVVTIQSETDAIGITANSFTSVSLEPPLVLFCVHHSSKVRSVFHVGASFVVNILAEDQEPLSRRFSAPDDRRANDAVSHATVTGAPALTDALAHVDCQLRSQIDAGDHVIILGDVRDWVIRCEDQRPLTFWRGRYRGLAEREVMPLAALD